MKNVFHTRRLNTAQDATRTFTVGSDLSMQWLSTYTSDVKM